MLRLFRASPSKKGPSIFIWILFGFLAVGLLGFNLADVATGLASQNVATVGSQKVSRDHYYRSLRTAVDGLAQRAGVNLTLTQARDFGITEQVLSQLVTEAALNEEAADLRVSVGDDTVRDEILNQPLFQNSGGNFDRAIYNFYLERSGLTPPEYEELARLEASRVLVEAGVTGGFVTPSIMAETLLIREREARDFSYVQLTRGQLSADLPEPTESELRALYDANPDDYTAAETREITYAALSAETVAETLEISEDELRAAYEEDVERFSTPERRIIDRLVFGTEEEAAATRARIEAGETDLDTVAAERGLEPGDLEVGVRTRNDLTIAESGAIFALEGPGIVGPVATDLGPALFRVNAILAAQSVPFEEAAETLRSEIAEAEAQGVVDLEIEPVQDLLAAGADPEEVAEATGLVLGTVSLTEAGGEGLAADAAFQRAARDAEVGRTGDLFDLAGGGIAVLRVDEIVPPTLRPYEDVVEEVRANWQDQAEQDALQAQANGLLARLQEARTLEAVAEAEGLGIAAEAGRTRFDVPTGLTAALMEQVFALDVGSAAIVEDASGYILVRLDAVAEFDPQDPENADDLERRRTELAASIAFDVLTGFAQGAQNAAGVSVNRDLIDQIISLNP